MGFAAFILCGACAPTSEIGMFWSSGSWYAHQADIPSAVSDSKPRPVAAAVAVAHAAAAVHCSTSIAIARFTTHSLRDSTGCQLVLETVELSPCPQEIGGLLGPSRADQPASVSFRLMAVSVQLKSVEVPLGV